MWCDQDISWLDIILWDLMVLPSLSLSHRLWYWWSTLANAWWVEGRLHGWGWLRQFSGLQVPTIWHWRSWRTENWITTTTYPSKSILKHLWSVSRTQTYSIKTPMLYVHLTFPEISQWPLPPPPQSAFRAARWCEEKKASSDPAFHGFSWNSRPNITWLLLRHHNTAKFIGKMVVPLGWGPLIINPIYTLCPVDIYRVYHETSKYQ